MCCAIELQTKLMMPVHMPFIWDSLCVLYVMAVNFVWWESHVLYETLADQTEPFYCFWCFISVAVTAKSSTVRCGQSLNGLSGVTQTRRRCIRKCSSVLSSVRNCRATWPSRRHQQNCRIKPIKTQIGDARICIFGIFTTSALKVAFQANLCLQCFDTVGWVAGRATGL